MRQNSIQNRLQMISMEEYLEKRQKIRETERKRDKKTVLQAAGTGCCRCDGRAVCLTEEHYSFESESSV